MTRSQASVPDERGVCRASRTRTTLAALFLGVPLAGGILAFIHFGPLKNTAWQRYVSHPLECVEVVMFCGALGALSAKLWSYCGERRACRKTILPTWDGKPQPIEHAKKLLQCLADLPRACESTLIVRRTRAVLDFLCKRGSAAELDDQLRSLADVDALALEGSYGLTKFITWAIPILGFLGTVLGITGAISGVTPEVLEQSLSTVTDGLALAFDATALALGLTMITMFCSFLVEKAEQGIHDQVDRYVEQELAHRFQRLPAEGNETLAAVRESTQVLTQAMERLVLKQVELWAQTLAEADRRRTMAEKHQQDKFTQALEAALANTLHLHRDQLEALEKHVLQREHGVAARLDSWTQALRDLGKEQQGVQREIAGTLARQAEALANVQQGEHALQRLQTSLEQNLAAIIGAGTFEQTLHSLNAAIHLLTAKVSPTVPPLPRSSTRPGAAA